MTDTPTVTAARHDLRAMIVFAAVALGVGGTLFGLSTVTAPSAPLILAAVYLGLALPALVLTYRDEGASGVRTLLGRCVRLPRPSWALPAAAFALPLAAFSLGSVLGGTQPITPISVGFYLADLVIGTVLVNLAEELGWTGCFQQRAMARWGPTGGSLVTAGFFTLIHVPLALAGVQSAGQAVGNVALVGAAAVGLRLLVGQLYLRTAGSVLAVGVLHSSFNATESLLLPAYDWIRIVTIVVLALVVVIVARATETPGARPRTRGLSLRSS